MKKFLLGIKLSMLIIVIATIAAGIAAEFLFENRWLGFVGVGMPVDAISLGNIVNQGRQSFTSHPYQMICPTAILCIITVAFYVIGNKFADASDPRNHV